MKSRQGRNPSWQQQHLNYGSMALNVTRVKDEKLIHVERVTYEKGNTPNKAIFTLLLEATSTKLNICAITTRKWRSLKIQRYLQVSQNFTKKSLHLERKVLFSYINLELAKKPTQRGPFECTAEQSPSPTKQELCRLTKLHLLTAVGIADQ